MNNPLFKQLPQITGGKLLQLGNQPAIQDLITDSRKASPTVNSLFFAISGKHQDGHKFIADLYNRDCKQFIVENKVDLTPFPDSSFLYVESAVQALQRLAKFHREQFAIPIIGITGSNGKTIVKEWLHQLLSLDYRIVKNPGSYNSQLGVPLSVWSIGEQHNLGIFEAGISKPDEMARLEEIIQPTVGIFTNVLSAHEEGFDSRQEKASEKAKLFKNSDVVLYCKDHTEVDLALQQLKNKDQKLISWGSSDGSVIKISRLEQQTYRIQYRNESATILKDFSDSASWENLFHCIAAMIYFGYSLPEITKRASQLKSLPMRLEMKSGINGSTIIDDSYSNDLAGLSIALDFFDSQRSGKGIVFLSDMLETGLKEEAWIDRIDSLLEQHRVDKIIAIGQAFLKNKSRITVPNELYGSVEDCLKNFNVSELTQATILIKGARIFRLEQLTNQFQRKIHGTVMEIDLNAVVHNLNVFRSRLKAGTKIMAMVKAFAYGSGSNEIASVLQYHKVDYLGVAYADEGKWLRSRGIHLPIMVMNPSIESISTLVDCNLEPSVYSLTLLRSLINHMQGGAMSIHLKLDTGMHRLGFDEDDLKYLTDLLKNNSNLRVKSIYSHLAGSDEPSHDDFTDKQVERFQEMTNELYSVINYPVLNHILNSAGISRLSQYQMDMVRLGIGLYGVDPGNKLNDRLLPAVTLCSTISQIKTVEPGETVGYGRHGKNKEAMKVATLSIGYADGYSRAFSKGIGKVLVKGKLAPVVGNVCMDMTMIDVTGIDVSEGEEVVVFGKQLPVTEVARWINTIPYEILTSTSDRVKRVFFAESV